MSKLPKFESDEEAADWFDAHDTADYMDSMAQTTDRLNVIRTLFPTRPLDVRLRADHLEAIQTLAEREGIPYQTLIRRWLVERLNQEGPGTVAP
jgi:predicted DNA binding CopG/RHH family protein